MMMTKPIFRRCSAVKKIRRPHAKSLWCRQMSGCRWMFCSLDFPPSSAAHEIAAGPAALSRALG